MHSPVLTNKSNWLKHILYIYIYLYIQLYNIYIYTLKTLHTREQLTKHGHTSSQRKEREGERDRFEFTIVNQSWMDVWLLTWVFTSTDELSQRQLTFSRIHNLYHLTGTVPLCCRPWELLRLCTPQSELHHWPLAVEGIPSPEHIEQSEGCFLHGIYSRH